MHELSCYLLPTHSSQKGQSQDSPTVMDSGRPAVGGTLVTTVGCGLESILKHINRRIILSWLNVFISLTPNLGAAMMAHLNVRGALLSQLPPGWAESHRAGKAAESSTELTEATCKRK